MAKQQKTWKMFNACTNPQRKWALWIESTTASNWYPLQMDKDQVLALRISPYIMNLLHQFYEICPISWKKSQHLNNLRSDPPCLGSSVWTCLPIVGIQWVLPSFLNLSSKMPQMLLVWNLDGEMGWKKHYTFMYIPKLQVLVPYI